MDHTVSSSFLVCRPGSTDAETFPAIEYDPDDASEAVVGDRNHPYICARMVADQWRQDDSIKAMFRPNPKPLEPSFPSLHDRLHDRSRKLAGLRHAIDVHKAPKPSTADLAVLSRGTIDQTDDYEG